MRQKEPRRARQVCHRASPIRLTPMPSANGSARAADIAPTSGKSARVIRGSQRRRPAAERGSSVGSTLAQRCGVWRQDQLRVVGDVADITVVADEADPAVA